MALAGSDGVPKTIGDLHDQNCIGFRLDGDSNKAIARRLGISLHTVKFHVESVFRKLGARTRTEAVAKAIERRRRETITL
jgi:FixJ family two-component response regulator